MYVMVTTLLLTTVVGRANGILVVFQGQVLGEASLYARVHMRPYLITP